MKLESIVCSVGDGKAASTPDALPATSSKRCPQEYFIFKRDLCYLYLCVCVCLSSVRISGYICGCMYVLVCVWRSVESVRVPELELKIVGRVVSHMTRVLKTEPGSSLRTENAFNH